MHKLRFRIWLSVILFSLIAAGQAAFNAFSDSLLENSLVRQTIVDNGSIGTSALKFLELSQSRIEKLSRKEVIDLIQLTSNEMRLPHNGYIQAVDSAGNVLVFPNKKLGESNNIREHAQFMNYKENTAFGFQFLNEEVFGDKQDEYYGFDDFFARERGFNGLYKAHPDSASEVMVALSFRQPNCNIRILVHQRQDQLSKRASAQISELKIPSIIYSFLLAVLAFFAVGKIVNNYQNEIDKKQEDLQKALDKVADKHEELQYKHEELEASHREKDGLLGVLAHDMRAPLNKIKGLLELSKYSATLTEDQELYFSMASDVISDAKALISDILEMSTIDSGELQVRVEPIQLKEFAEENLVAFKKVAEDKGIEIVSPPISEKEIIHTDPVLLKRILDNLLSNAIKFSPEGSKVSVEIVQEQESKYRITIADEGPGIPTDEAHLLFKKFQKLSTQPTKGESSTGLGLYIVKVLVERLNGVISLDEAHEKGAVFHVLLPQTLSM